MTPLELAMSEAINPQLDALLRADFHSHEVLLVYADWLEERADPRGPMIRLHLKEDAERRANTAKLARVPSATVSDPHHEAAGTHLVANWRRWLGSISWQMWSFGWQHGFIWSARLCDFWSDWPNLRPLLSLPVMRFVRSLRVDAFHFPGTIEGIDLAPILDTLFWEARMAGSLAPLSGLLMPALKSLDLDVTAALSAEDRRALSTVAVPKLRKLSLYLSTVDQAEILETLVASPWFGALESASISVTNGHALTALIRLGPSKSRLSIFLPPDEMNQQRALLRKSFPSARLTALPSGVRSDSDNCPRVRDTPKRAPQNYKDFDPWIILEPEKDWGRRVQMGSGIPFGSLGMSLLSLCGSCASEDTLCIFHETAVSYGEDHTAHYENWECECRECGLFTQYVNNRYT